MSIYDRMVPLGWKRLKKIRDSPFVAAKAALLRSDVSTIGARCHFCTPEVHCNRDAI